jgi:hypothetical protein
MYEDRDVEELGAHFLRHLDAITEEELGGKSAIAAELAYRDMQIEQLQLDAYRYRHLRAAVFLSSETPVVVMPLYVDGVFQGYKQLVCSGVDDAVDKATGRTL